MPTIEPDTQCAILDMLPDDYDRAIELMCQLMANIIISGSGQTLQSVTSKIEFHHAAYAGT